MGFLCPSAVDTRGDWLRYFVVVMSPMGRSSQRDVETEARSYVPNFSWGT